MVIGRLLDNRYKIIEQVGGGGMSLVYRAKDVFLNRVVAIKILREQFTCDEEFVARFRQEAQAVASLSHSNIVSIYDVGQDAGTYYLVMEMVEGRDLKEIIKEKGALSLQKTVDIAGQICDAVEHAHEHHIIHRDIKPHNIIITAEGKAKVTDFGIARAVSTATITHTGSVMGSVHYFSPEQARGEIADERSDIYSLGVVLYEMLTGVLPFEGESPISVALKKIQHDPVSPQQINPQIGDNLEKVILRSMDKEPKKRYSSVRQLKEDLISVYLYNRLENEEQGEVTEDTITVPALPKRIKGTDKQMEVKKELAPSLKTWIWIMIGLVIFGFVIGMYLSAAVSARGDVKVPDITNLSVEEAKIELDNTYLVLNVEKTVNHPTVAEGLIISQVPQAEEVVKKKEIIQVTVSAGPQLVEVPGVINNSLFEAEVALENQALIGEITRAYNSQIPVGHVISQEPNAYENVPQGTTVKLVVSKGPEPVYIKMPVLTGYKLAEVKQILESNQLELVNVQPETSYRYGEGTVIRQDPGANSDILQGSAVNLVVSSGPGPVGEEDY